jgi:hypothetical protein
LESSKPPQKVFEIDFIGGGTFQTSQNNILHQRSLDLYSSKDSKLSARGLCHRPPATFERERQIASNVISGQKRVTGKQTPSAKLFPSFFQRALASEKLGNTTQAIRFSYTSAGEGEILHSIKKSLKKIFFVFVLEIFWKFFFFTYLTFPPPFFALYIRQGLYCVYLY